MSSTKYQLQNFIGGGKIGKVYHANNLESGEKVIIKVMKHTEKYKDNINRDVNIPQLIVHDNIIKILDYYEKEGYCYIVYPYVENALSIEQILKLNKMTKKKNIIWLLKSMLQISAAIEFMHSKSVVHRDIKPSNIIINDYIAILIDFDLASTVNNPMFPIRRGIIGTPNYLDPAIWTFSDNISYQSTDVYSFGITLYFIFNKQTYPYRANTLEKLEYAIRYNKPIPSKSGLPELDKLIMTIIDKNPKMRPEIYNIKISLCQITSTLL